jgi:hypothetical protein
MKLRATERMTLDSGMKLREMDRKTLGTDSRDEATRDRAEDSEYRG